MHISNKVELIGWHLPDDVDYIDLREALDRIQKLLDYEVDELSRSVELLEFLINEKYCQAFIMVEFDSPIGNGKLPMHEAYHCPHWDKIEERIMGFSFDAEKNEVRSGSVKGKLRIPQFGFERGLATFAHYLMHTDKLSSPAISSLTVDRKTEAIETTITEAIRRASLRGESLDRIKLPGTRNDLAQLLRKKYPELLARYDQEWMNARFKKLGIKFGRGQRVGSGFIWQELFPDDFLI